MPPGAFAAQGGDASGCPEIPAGAPALVITLTIADPVANGNARVWPFGVPLPLASNINFRTGVNIANTTVTSTCFMCASDFNVFTSQSAHVIIDINGYFRPKDKIVDLQLMDASWNNATLTTTPNRGFSIASGSNGGFQTSTFLPSDYSADTLLIAVFYMSSAASNCTINWSATEPLRDVYPGANPGDALTIPPIMTDLTGIPANVTFGVSTEVSVGSATVLPNDLFTLGWSRGTSGDTCAGNLVVNGGVLLYQ